MAAHYSSRMMTSMQDMAEEAADAAAVGHAPSLLSPSSPSSAPPADYAPFDLDQPLNVKHDMADHSIATTQGIQPHADSMPTPNYTAEKEPNEENQSAIEFPGMAYMAPGIVMRSLSNKVRVYSDEASMDERDSRRESANIDDRDGYRHTAKPTRFSEQEWQTMAKFAKAQGQDLMKQVEEQKRRQLAEHEAARSPSPDNIAKSEMDEMRRILKERSPRDSEEYFKNVPTESERDSSPERVPRRKKHHHHRHHHHHIEANGDYADKELPTDYDTSSSCRDSYFISSDINGDLRFLATEDPSKVLDWLRGYGGTEPDKRIVLSEDRILDLLKALREGALCANEGLMQRESWVPMEKLREAERRSSAAEEQIRYFEQLFNLRDGFESGIEQEDHELCTVLTKSKTIDRHFAHMKKFAEDRHKELKRMYSNISDKDVKTWRANVISPSRNGLVSIEKAKKELQEHENHKKRLAQVFSNYNELLRLLKVEHAKRIDAENKSFQLTSQLKRQTATLKRAEKVIKHTALSPIVFNESHSFDSRAPNFASSDRNSMQASPYPYKNNSGRQSPSAFSSPSTPLDNSSSPFGLHSQANLHRNYTDCEVTSSVLPVNSNSPNNIGKITIRTSANSSPTPSNQTISKQLTYDVALDHPHSRNMSPVPHLQLPTSAAEDQRKEFQELENALIEEGRSKGFADVDLYSEKKTVGKAETCWEYRHVHFDFTRPNQAVAGASVNEERRPASPCSSREALEIECVSNLPISRRTASPGRSEGSSCIEEKCEDLQKSAADGRDHDLLSSIASYREGLERIHKQEDSSKQIMSPISCSSSARSPLKLAGHSYPAPAASSPLKLHTEVFSIPDMKNAEETSRVEAAGAMKKSSKKMVAQKADDDVAENDEVAPKSGPSKQRFFDHVADTKSSDAAEADVAQRVEMQPSQQVTGLKQMRGGHVSSKQKSTSDLRRRVAAIEASNVAHRLHSQVKTRLRVLLVQVVLLGVALMWGVLPSSLRSIPPPT